MKVISKILTKGEKLNNNTIISPDCKITIDKSLIGSGVYNEFDHSKNPIGHIVGCDLGEEGRSKTIYSTIKFNSSLNMFQNITNYILRFLKLNPLFKEKSPIIEYIKEIKDSPLTFGCGFQVEGRDGNKITKASIKEVSLIKNF